MSEPCCTLWRFTISSGQGKEKIRQAVMVKGEKPFELGPSLRITKSAITKLMSWALDNYPDRHDWILSPQIEALQPWMKEE